MRGLRPTSTLAFGSKLSTLHGSAPAVVRQLRAMAAATGRSYAEVYAASNQDLTVEVQRGVIMRRVFVQGCQVTIPDVDAVNGVASAVDCVLLPPPPEPLPGGRSVGAILRARFEASMYRQALQATGFLDAIDQATPDAPVTAFAPSNAAFIVYAAMSPGCGKPSLLLPRPRPRCGAGGGGSRAAE